MIPLTVEDWWTQFQKDADFETEASRHGIKDPYSEAFARSLDQHDDLLTWSRDQFHIPRKSDRPLVYLSGNSLGLQPKTTAGLVFEDLQVWRESAVEGHSSHPGGRPWVRADEECVRLLMPLVGAEDPKEIACMSSLTTNLHLLMSAFYRPTRERFKILLEHSAFPSDQAALHGLLPDTAVISVGAGGMAIGNDDFIDRIQQEGSSIAVILFGGLQYYTGQLFDLEGITKAAHEQGCTVILDLAHAVGNVPLSLHHWGVDCAAWCSYKYLNGGPGGVAGIFVHSKHHGEPLKILRGWWGERPESRFKMLAPPGDPDEGARLFQQSNLPVLSTACLLASLRIFNCTNMHAIRLRSARLVRYFRFLLQEQQCTIITPEDPRHSGAQVSLIHHQDSAERLMGSLEAAGIICDLRPPNCLRMAFVGLYTSYWEVYEAARVLKSLLN